MIRVKLATYWRLGLANIARVAWYQLRLRSGWLRHQLPIGEPVVGEFFVADDVTISKWSESTVKQLTGQDYLSDCIRDCILFGNIPISLTSPCPWLTSVLNQKSFAHSAQHWSLISDFASGVGDIKGVWEPSRFTWAIHFAQRYVIDGDPKWISQLNEWIADWSQHNPFNQGPNWKCAQETSMRVLHLSAVALTFKNPSATLPLQTFLKQHLTRILPTMGYAMAQDNNHGTSEAAALYIGGSWLLKATPNDSFAKRCVDKGRAYLHNRVQHLILNDGTFSQYSVTYHRLLLDSLSLVELWRRLLDLPSFSESYKNSAGKASEWLQTLVEPSTGDAPNLGSNDGAHILNFAHAAYRDFRPTVELASQLFLARGCYDDPASQTIRELFDLDGRGSPIQVGTRDFHIGGLGVLRFPRGMCALKIPSFVFRPVQADIFHLDLWLDGENLLPDGGTYSYNTDAEWLVYFSGCRSHNTVEFDGHEPMPKVSRFLYGQWPQYHHWSIDDESMECEYTQWQGVRHYRKVHLTETALVVIDRFCGVTEKAVLRWRLAANREWQVDKHRVFDQKISLTVECDQQISGFDVTQGAQSLYYGQKSLLPVLEVSTEQDATITTTINWQ